MIEVLLLSVIAGLSLYVYLRNRTIKQLENNAGVWEKRARSEREAYKTQRNKNIEHTLARLQFTSNEILLKSALKKAMFTLEFYANHKTPSNAFLNNFGISGPAIKGKRELLEFNNGACKLGTKANQTIEEINAMTVNAQIRAEALKKVEMTDNVPSGATASNPDKSCCMSPIKCECEDLTDTKKWIKS